MMWCTKVIGLVALTASVICNAGELESGETNIRADAEQDPFEPITMSGADGPISSLFGDCLLSARTMQVNLYTIEMPGTTDEFHRHVPDFYERTVPVGWEKVTSDPPVSNILECAAAVYEMDKPMFKYNGGDDCKLSNRSYSWRFNSACEQEELEAVFVGDFHAGGCKLPGRMLNINTTMDSCDCVHVTTDLMSYDEAKQWCTSQGNELFVQTKTKTYSVIAEFLMGLNVNGQNVSASNFFTGASASTTTNLWYWDPQNKYAVNSSLYPSYTWSAGDALYMKGTAGFTLDYAPKSSFKAGVVCMVDNISLEK